ncbi:MAG TPA: RIP metalloprotease RseP [Blastocatellia bacterium]|nr:RIP metalloprotease RseP [Blastocatellia bacterium]
MLGIIVFILVLGGMIVIHEFGHFIVAKLFGIRVEVFSVGFGKRLAGFKRGDTDYRLSLIPLGGYVKMAGENLDEQRTGAPDEFMSKPRWQRLLVAVAGPVMNVLTAFAIIAILAMIHFETEAYKTWPAQINAVEPDSPADKAGIKRGDLIVKIDGEENPMWRDVEDVILVHPDQSVPVTVKRGDQNIDLTLPVASRPYEQEEIGYAGFKPDVGPDAKIMVRGVHKDSPADKAGLKAGDQIIAVNSKPIEQSVQGNYDVIRAIRESNSQPLAMTLKRGDEIVNITATPQMDAGEYRLGFEQELADVPKIVTRLGPIAAMKFSLDENKRILKLTKTAIMQMFAGTRSPGKTLTGPIGILGITQEATDRGAWYVFNLMALLSLNLGIFNLLPIPVLDGGLIFMLLLESLLGVFGVPLSLRVKERMMQVGFVVLILLMGFVIFNDISKKIPSSSTPQQQQQQQQQQQPNGRE